MNRTLIRDLAQSIGTDVCIQGWVHTIRDQKAIAFIIVRDQTGLVQVTIDKSKSAQDVVGTLPTLTRESTVTIKGRLIANPVVKLGGIEIQPTEFRVESAADPNLPLDPLAQIAPNSDVRMDWRFLDLRRAENLLTFRVQTTALTAMREFWKRENFIELQTPKLMGSASESGAELFTLDYFGRPAYLAQSPQFYKQMAMAAGFERVFEIGPAFRADPSFTPRHATEFTSVDVELSWIDSHHDVMDHEARWLQFVLQAVQDEHGSAIAKTFGAPVNVPAVPFPKLTMAEVTAILAKLGHTLPPEKKGDLDPQAERLLGEFALKEFGHEFVFVTDWDKSVRAFYHMRYPDNPNITKGFDLLWKGTEITTGAQREHRYEVLVAQARDKGFAPEPLQFYFDFFKYGCPPHGGFGFGLARFIALMLNRGNIREVTFLFRGPTRLEP